MITRSERSEESHFPKYLLSAAVGLCINGKKKKKKKCSVGIAVCGIREKRVKEVTASEHLHRYFRYLSSAFISSTSCAKKWGRLHGLCHEI